MKELNLNDFLRELTCVYAEERYSVRDNGAVLRHSRTGKRTRPNDNQWTFGKPNSQNGYMHISSVRTHRIIATAFHGEPPTPEHVVDHIDTNRRNNRPENLRWLTRLENVLLNPITVKRIELICGSVEAFLEDPSKLSNSGLDQNFEWMRKVSPQEAQSCLARMLIWANSDKQPSSSGSLREWVFKSPFLEQPSKLSETLFEPQIVDPLPVERDSFVVFKEPTKISAEMPRNISELMAKTPRAVQRKERTQTEFPCCPQNTEEEPIKAYAAKLTVGAIFCCNDWETSIVLNAAVTDEGKSICVISEGIDTCARKPWSLVRITFEDGLYVHTTMETFFSKEGAEKQFCLTRRLEWAGGHFRRFQLK